ncbi:MAG: hypothetical protein BWK80_47865 [Desulfobacteraceae bacterium IS3]|nr:MAG: hypothetical protein BWK80_47865 [Desulfobacteraceae bacterium IS3]
MIKYLLDTNVISEWMKPVPDPSVIRKIKYHFSGCATAAPLWLMMNVLLSGIRLNGQDCHLRGNR